jgi:hypothetical protein
MLPLGVIVLGQRSTRFTPDEQRTLMTLWSVARSPLMHGGDMTRTDDFTFSLLTNDEVLAVNQRSANNRPLFSRDELIAWIADDPDSPDKYLAVFNARDRVRLTPEDENSAPGLPVAVSLADLGFTRGAKIRDLWTHRDLGVVAGDFAPVIPFHGAGLYRITPVP